MKAIIVAGGRGERLRPLTDKIPKPMVEVLGKPILLHIIERLRENGVKDIVIALCYLPKVITDFFENGARYGVNISYIFEDPGNPMGTAGAILGAKKFIKNTFIVTYGDILRDLDIGDMRSFHKKNKSFATLNVYERESKGAKSRILINTQNRIVKFIERPVKKELSKDYIWASGSFYILNPEIFDWIPNSRKSDFGADIFPKLLVSSKTLYAYPTVGYFIDIGDKNKLEKAKKTFSVRFNSPKTR